MTADAPPLPDGLPAGFDLDTAAPGERVPTADGTYVVLESQLAGENHLVPADLVEYGLADHPFIQGMGGFMTVIAAFVLPLWAGTKLFAAVDSTALSVVGVAAAILAAWVAANTVLYRTFVGDQVFRFLEWQDHLGAIEALRQREEAA